MGSTLHEFHTDRLHIRALTKVDAVTLFNVRNNPMVNLYIARTPPADVQVVEQFIQDRNTDITKGKLMYWAIATKTDSKLIGTTCLWNFNMSLNGAEVGYELHPDYHGKGIMTEVLSTILTYGFNTLNLNHIEAFTQKGNTASRKLLERFGFSVDPNRKDEKVPENLIYIKYA